MTENPEGHSVPFCSDSHTNDVELNSRVRIDVAGITVQKTMSERKLRYISNWFSRARKMVGIDDSKPSMVSIADDSRKVCHGCGLKDSSRIVTAKRMRDAHATL